MKLIHPELESVFQTEGHGVQSIVIENPVLFRDLVQDLQNQCNGIGGKFVLSRNNRPIDISHNVEMFSDFVGFSINQKTLISKIISTLEKESRLPGNDLQTQDILQQVELYLDRLAFAFPCNLQYSKLNVSALLKAAGIQLNDEYQNPIERLIDYMELVREYDKEKLFITINYRGFLTDEECNLFLETVISHELKLLMFERFDFPILENERRITIDNDLCEF